MFWDSDVENRIAVQCPLSRLASADEYVANRHPEVGNQSQESMPLHFRTILKGRVRA